MGTRSRLAAGAVWLAAGLAACGSSGSPASRPQSSRPRSGAGGAPTLTRLAVVPLGRLGVPVQDSAAAALPDGRVVLMGGLAGSGGSTGAINILTGGRARPGGALPGAQHDAQAAALGSSAYVFGGGASTQYDHILRYDPATGSVTQVGALPSPASDVAVTSIGDTAFVVGGYNGSVWLDTVLAWTPGRSVRLVARLPTGLRYAAVAAVGSQLIIAGGTETHGISDAIIRVDTATGTVKRIGRLPAPLTHASAAALDGRVVIVGGKHELVGHQSSAVLAIDPATGAVATVGRLPRPLSDADVAATDGRIVVAGGDNGNGPQSAVLGLVPIATAR